MTDRRKRIFSKMVNSSLAPFWGTVSRNWFLKLLCVVLAFAVWQAVRENTSYEVLVSEVPVTVTAGAGRAVLDQSTDTVDILFRGSQDEVRFISSDQISVEVDISRRRDKLRQTVKLAPRYVKGPSRAHAVQFDPPDVTVTIDREVERSLPVKAVFDGELPSGVQLAKAACEPASVRVHGAEQLLRNLEQVHTVPISLDGRYTSFRTHTSVAADGRPWTAAPDRVTVDVQLVEKTATRRIERTSVRPLVATGDARRISIAPDTVAVELGGSPEQINALNPSDLYAYIDCAELTETTDYEVQVRVDVPDGIRVEQVEPAIVKVSVKKM